MRVLLVVHGFPPWALGGTEIYTHDLARALHDYSGDDVFVFARESDPDRPEYNVRVEHQAGLHVTFVNNTFRACRSFEETYRNPRIRQIGGALLDEIRPDVVHVQHVTCLSTELMLEFRRRAIPTIFTLNDYWLICHRGQLLDLDYNRCEGPYPSGCARCVARAGVRCGDQASGSLIDSVKRLRHMRDISSVVTHFLAPSRTLLHRFLEFGIAADRITYREQGIRQAGFAGLRRTASDRLRIGFMGSLLISKAPHLLLQAFAGLPRGSASLHIFGSYAPYHGDDRYREQLTPLLAKPNVFRPGPIAHEKVPEALASVDVLVVPSVWIENAPFVIREAFTAGVPVVASRIGGMAELVSHEKNGLLFDVGDAVALRSALLRLLSEHGLVDRLRAGIPRMRTIAEDAQWTRGLYQASLRVRASP